MTTVLSLESSCDETAAAVVRDGHVVLAEAVSSQADDFAQWGGVVPEIAARGHVAELPGIALRVVEDSGLQPNDLDAIAVAAWPGLIGSLLCGVTAAKTLAARWGVDLVAVDHIASHLAAIHLGRPEVIYPLVGLVASGGHSHLYRCDAPGSIELLGGTIDDAAGEAFDKAAATLELGYPGGPALDALAEDGDPRTYDLPRSFRHDDTLRYSFAGLKTAFLYKVRGPVGRDPLTLDEQGVRDAAASFRHAVVESLIDKLVLAAQQADVRSIAVGGGVACNRLLRRRLAEVGEERDWTVLMPEPRHCADNAAMVGALGCFAHARGDRAALDLQPLPTGRAGPRSIR